MAQICKDVKELDQDTQIACNYLLEEANKQGLNIKVTETYRTLERQKELYAQGRTTPGKIVTNCDGVKSKSIHQSRRAFDVCHNKKGDEYNERILKKAGEIGMSIGLTWGGSWGWDSPHFELDAGKKPNIPQPDTDYEKAVHKLAQNININVASWYPIANMNIKNVPALINKMGGINQLVEKKIISDCTLWENLSYKANHVRSLIIKYAASL